MNNKISVNAIASIAYQFISIIIGLFLPRALLTSYGVEVHGTISTINNIMNYVMLLNAGLSTAAMQALYKPLRDSDHERVSRIYNSIRISYIYTAILVAIAILGVSVVLPVVIGNEVSGRTVCILVIVMGLQYIFENLFYNAERTVIQADNRLYIVNLINSISHIFRGITQLLMVCFGAPIWMVMSVPAALVLFRSVITHRVFRKNFKCIDIHSGREKSALKKRKYAFVHQIAGLVLNNTDVILLTFFWSQSMVSKYSVYSLVLGYLYLFLSQVFSASVVAHLGKNVLKNGIDTVRAFFCRYEYICYIAISIVYSVTSVMLLPFVKMYTLGVEGMNYVDGVTAVLFLIYGVIYSIRIPSLTVIDAKGLYKETQHQAIIEMILNLGISILLCPVLGINGVLIGTITAFTYRTISTVQYVNINVLNNNGFSSLKHVVAVVCVCVTTSILYRNIVNENTVLTWSQWLFDAFIVFAGAMAITMIVNLIVNLKETKELIKIILLRIRKI